MALLNTILHFYLMALVSVGEGVGVWVVEQRFVALAPRETLGTYTEVIVFDEFWPFVVSALMRQVAIHGAQQDRWHSHEYREVLPYFVTT